MWDNERILLTLIRLSSMEERISSEVIRYFNFNFGYLYVIEVSNPIASHDELLSLLGGQRWFHGRELEVRLLFNYILLDLLRAPLTPSVGLVVKKRRVYLGVHYYSHGVEGYDWDTIASELGKALQGTPS